MGGGGLSGGGHTGASAPPRFPRRAPRAPQPTGWDLWTRSPEDRAQRWVWGLIGTRWKWLSRRGSPGREAPPSSLLCGSPAPWQDEHSASAGPQQGDQAGYPRLPASRGGQGGPGRSEAPGRAAALTPTSGSSVRTLVSSRGSSPRWGLCGSRGDNQASGPDARLGPPPEWEKAGGGSGPSAGDRGLRPACRPAAG